MQWGLLGWALALVAAAAGMCGEGQRRVGKAETNLAGVRLAPRLAGLPMGHRCRWQRRAGVGWGRRG